MLHTDKTLKNVGKLLQERDDLLEACKYVLDYMQHSDTYKDEPEEILKQVIAKAEDK